MKYFICVGHANYGGGVISSADGTSKGGVNEYKYNKELAPYVPTWTRYGTEPATLRILAENPFFLSTFTITSAFSFVP